MRPDDQNGPVDSDERADEVWEDESPAAVPGQPAETDASSHTTEPS